MRLASTLIVLLALPGAALAQQDGLLNKAAKGAIDAVLPPGEAPADAKAPEAAAPPPKPGDLVNNPPFAHWSQFAVGTTVAQKEVVTLADGTTAENVIAMKLLSKSKDNVVVEAVVTAGGAGKRAGAVEETKTVSEYPAKVKFENTSTPAAAGYSITEGKELVTVKGKEIEAEWVEATATNGGETVVEKIWTAKEIPGGIVKQTVKRSGGGKSASDSVLEIVTYEAKLEPAAKP